MAAKANPREQMIRNEDSGSLEVTEIKQLRVMCGREKVGVSSVQTCVGLKCFSVCSLMFLC